MNTKLLLLALVTLAPACGKHVLIGTTYSGTRTPCLDDQMALSSNCQTGAAAPTPTPAPPVSLVFQGDVPSPPPSKYTLVGNVRVPSGTPAMWQSLGQNNQPVVTRTVATTMTMPGQCRNVDIKVQVTNGGTHDGTFYLGTDGNRFRVCEEDGKVVVEFEDAVDTKFNDYRVEISSSTGQPLRYRWVSGWLQVCLD